ncbi:nuclear transport factor 2 family protein [Pseudoduganella sp. LjRoot289]|uniref:nuclear transport factor 2 family protein n=1 Tax=Pseudoduganella sp. LjRoot289 TaxID=3342314 RepID=UPI003ECD5D48
MRPAALLFLTAVLPLALPPSAQAASCLPVPDLIARDAQYEEAMRIGDAAFLDSHLAEDFVWVHNLVSSIDDKAAVVARARKPASIPKARTTSDVKAQVFDNTVVLRGLSTVDAWNSDGKTWRSNRYQFMRTYVNTPSGCKLLAVQTMKVWSSEKAAGQGR